MSAIVVGPWGGTGGNAFDDGWSNDGVSKLTIYYNDILQGFQVVYGNGTVKLHGRAIGTSKEVDFISALATFGDISVIVGTNRHYFTTDPNGTGVVAMGASASTIPVSLPTSQNGNMINPKLQILGFFGSSGYNVDRLGIYISMPSN